jgi:lysophospholipase L1-like esterase
VCAAAAGLLPPALQGGKRIIFLGDSITYAGSYVDFVEAAVRLRDPAWRGEILVLGLPSETVSGLSEPNHAGGRFPRPDLHERLERVLGQTRPDLVVACYGMNDGIYRPFAEERFEGFRSGMTRLREKVAAVGAAVIHLTPPVFDPQPIADKVLPDGLAAYAGPFGGYDDVLARYSAWLVAQRSAGWEVVDIHEPMSRELVRRRRDVSTFAFAKDGVHPDRLGHAVIARAILLAWGFPAELAEAPLEWAAAPESELLRLVRTRRKLLSDAWLTATGHERPGMAKGLPLDAAAAQSADLEDRIRAHAARKSSDHFSH